MEIITDDGKDLIFAEDTKPGEVYKLQNTNQHYLRVVTCATKANQREGFKFVSLPNCIISQFDGDKVFVKKTSKLIIT